jgi:L-amino acid N-acyltransferase YncA
MPIRAAQAKDIPAVVELCRQFHAESWYSRVEFDPEWLGQVLSRFAATPPQEALFLVAHREEDIYGFIVAHMGPVFSSRRKAAIQDMLYVRADRRGGIAGPALLRRYMQWAAPLSPIFLDYTITTGINEESWRRLAERFGFRDVGTVFRWHPTKS